MKKKVVIIGGGIAGLSAGIYAAANGFVVEIHEMHFVAGGQCTAWERKKYRFDYCLHWLVGTRTGAFNQIWNETNVLNYKTEVINHEVHSKIFDKERNEFTIYADIDRWEKYLIEFAPDDKNSIRKMCKDMRKGALLEPFYDPAELRSIFDYIKILPKMLPLLKVIRKFGRIRCDEYFAKLRFKNKKLINALNSLYGNRDFSALAFIFMLSFFNQKNAGYIKGGSLPLALRMLERFIMLGGSIKYRSKVEKIIVENDQAKGIVLSDGTKVNSDYVISAADGYNTIYNMLDGKYLTKKIETAYKDWELFTPIVQVSFGVNKSLPSDYPIIINTSNNLVAGSTLLKNGFSVMNYSYDSTMAPKGKTTIVLRFDSPWSIWESMDGETYDAEKKKIETDSIRLIEIEYPGISEFIEVVDVATPKTNVYYTGVRKGAYEGFLPTSKNMMSTLDMRLPGLTNFLMVGQWLFPGGGLPPAAQSGKWAVQLICKQENKKFKTDLLKS